MGVIYMKILNFGSLNIDYVYSVDHFVQKGETISSSQMNIFSGGKGLNQSTALGRAGAQVFHAGRIGKGGEFLVEPVSYTHLGGQTMTYDLNMTFDDNLVTGNNTIDTQHKELDVYKRQEHSAGCLHDRNGIQRKGGYCQRFHVSLHW